MSRPSDPESLEDVLILNRYFLGGGGLTVPVVSYAPRLMVVSRISDGS